MGMVCPIDWRTIDEVSEMTGMKVSPFLCSASEIHHAHEQYFGHSKDGASTTE
jgi:hypothetical protein